MIQPIPRDLPTEDHIVEMYDRMWERQLAVFFDDIRHDLEQGLISVDQAIQRIQNIRRQEYRE